MKLNVSVISISIASLCVLCVVLAIVPAVRSASSSLSDQFIGIAPGDEEYYKSSGVIQCKDGSKKFTKAQLNDDFCDCPDGTDEPGTSACPRGKFYCQNAGHVSRTLFSSMVNDGICDCCDGSDEYDGKVKCTNTCWEAGKVARDKLKKKISTYQEGYIIRKQEVEQAKVAIAKDDAELYKLKDEEKLLKPLVQQLKERKEQIEKAEEKERLRKEKEEKEKREVEEKANERKIKAEEESKQDNDDNEDKPMNESKSDDKIVLLYDSSPDKDVPEEHVDLAEEVELADTPESKQSLHNRVEKDDAEEKRESQTRSEIDFHAQVKDSPDEVPTGNDVPKSTEELSREELGRLVASRWTGENTDKQTDELDASKDNEEAPDETPKDAHDEEYDGYASETDDESQKYDNDTEDEIDEDPREDEYHDDPSSSSRYDSDIESDFSDIDTSSNPSWLEKIQQTIRNVLQAVNIFQTPVNPSDAALVRKEYDESSAKLSKIQSRISSLTNKLKQDFGPEKEFYSFYGHCFESKQNKYVYKVCPYKQASQVEGHSTTNLGRWDKFEDSNRVMIFSNGDKCWNGPDRSLKVKLRCGLTNEVTDVDEPSRCEYVALLSTPTVCYAEKLQELQHKLDAMNQEHLHNHDEL